VSDSILKKVLAKHAGAGREKLIPILQAIQEAEGFISKEAVIEVGRHLGLPASKVYGVATFYNQFRFSPPGRFHVMICRGTACHVKGSAAVLEAIKEHLGIEPGKTSRDRMWSLEVVACMGACGMAPVISVNGEFHAEVTPESVHEILDSYAGKALQDETA
jgi:NADH:ubiquinone oxidoreductase subunit E